MCRSLTVLFRRNPSGDRESEKIEFEGYNVFWPDGRPVTVGLDAFCKHGQRLLGLGKHLAGCREKLVSLLYLPLASLEDDLHRIPGHRVRRFYLERQGQIGRLHFMNGTPTNITFDLIHDEQRVLQWVGLPSLKDGERQWFDLAAVTVNPAR
jgi:hypothetical protein